MCPVVSADVRGGERLRDEPKERLRRRLGLRGFVVILFIYLFIYLFSTPALYITLPHTTTLLSKLLNYITYHWLSYIYLENSRKKIRTLIG